MSDHAFQAQYRQEFVAGFEQRESFTRQTVTTEVEIKGQTAIFLVADSAGATAVSRGLNGLIPAKADDLTQYTTSLVEWHDLRRRTGFNLFASQSDGRRIMQMNSMAVMNRRIDADIVTELQNATLTTGAAATGSLDMVTYALAILTNNDVPMDGNVSALITGGFYSYLLRTKEFTNVDYVNNKPFEGRQIMFRWAGVNFIVQPNLPGKGTNAEKCFMYHKSALGHAYDGANVSTNAGYDQEQDYSYARTTAFMGSKILQNSGIVVMNHDGSGFAPV